jgi:hypothetical protein
LAHRSTNLDWCTTKTLKTVLPSRKEEFFSKFRMTRSMPPKQASP